MDSKTPASEAKRIAELELENERLKQAYKYIHASRNSVDEELNEANKEITRLKAELEREIELRNSLIPIAQHFITVVDNYGLKVPPEILFKYRNVIEKAKN